MKEIRLLKKINNKDIIVYERSPNLFDKFSSEVTKGKIQVILLDSYHISKLNCMKASKVKLH